MTISTKMHIQFRVARGLATRVMLLGLSAVLASTAYAQPIEIFTADDLDDIRDDLAADYILMADIDLSGFALAPIGSDADRFTGTFNRNSFTIRNFTDDGFPGVSSVGLSGATNGSDLWAKDPAALIGKLVRETDRRATLAHHIVGRPSGTKKTAAA